MAEKRNVHLIVPVTLILLAGFLSTIQQPIFYQSSPLTGFNIVDITTCNPDDVLFQTSDITNAHVYQAGTDASIAPYAACPFPNQGTGDPADYQCHNTCANNPNNANCNAILNANRLTNAHAEQKDQTNYLNQFCFTGVQCEYTTFPEDCSTLGPDYVCVATMSDISNAHVGDCTSSPYSIHICCQVTGGTTPTSPDADNDGVQDDGDNSGFTNDNPCRTNELSNCDDNCRTIPNGPTVGSCSNDNTLRCVDDSQCSGGTCDQAQTDTDGDGAGDVCDANPSDSCTISVPDDNCPGFINCAKGSLDASWGSTTASEGSSVSLSVTGDSSCDDLTFQFNVINTNNPSIMTIDPQPATFNGGSASSSWTTEYHQTPVNEYQFQASTTINGSSLAITSSNTVTVTANSNALCGNGLIEGSNNEECDDGGTKDNDGCSSDCLLEGIEGEQCSNECPVNGLGVCDASGDIQYCGNFDGDPCLELSTPKACASGTLCKNNYGDALCIPPVCDDAFTCTISECVDGFKKRSCTNTGSNVCNYYNPTIDIPCIKVEQPEQLPAFTIINTITVILLLGLFYTIRKKR
jgi:cysteine-rich repeat protein